MLTYTSEEHIPSIYSDLRTTFRTGKTKPIAYRRQQLAQLAWMIRDHQDRWAEALKSDLGRPKLEAEL
jgi:aldehyde dehydrogenase (NAD+)